MRTGRAERTTVKLEFRMTVWTPCPAASQSLSCFRLSSMLTSSMLTKKDRQFFYVRRTLATLGLDETCGHTCSG